MNNIQESYENYIKGYDDILSLNLVPKMAMYEQISIMINEQYEKIKKKPLLFHIYDSLYTEVFITLAKLLENDTSSNNINKFLNFCESNRRNIKWKDGNNISFSTISEHKCKLNKVQNIIDKIKNRRNKYIAHMDKEYFLNIKKLDEDFPIDNDEIIQLIICFQEIIGDHMGGLTGVVAVSVDDIYKMATYNLLSKICDDKI